MYNFNSSADRTNTNAEKYTLRKKLFGTDDVLPMWVADMDIDTPPFIFESIKNRLDHPILGYEEFPTSAKEVQIKWIKDKYNTDISLDQLLYSHSVVTSINIAIQAFSEIGDEIIVQPPVYFPFFSSIKNNNRKILRNPLKKTKSGKYKFDLDDLTSKITQKTKMILLCSPHNPVGRVWSKKELTKLTEICLKNNIIIFSDEIHSDLILDKNKHTPLYSFGKNIQDITITSLGVGKTFNLAGISTSTVLIQNDILRKKFIQTASRLHLAEGNVLGHIAFESAYKNGKVWLGELLEHLEKNIKKLDNLLKKHNNLITFKKPEGTYLVWLDCSKMGLNDKELREFFIDKCKLGLSPGTSFGKEGHGYMRMNIAVPSDTMDEAINRVEKGLKEFTKK